MITTKKRLNFVRLHPMVLFLFFFIFLKVNAQRPTISFFAPLFGNTNDLITITGTSFNPTTTNNIVYFGATRATVISSSPTSLTVRVPAGATHAFITVINTATSLQAASINKFTPSFSPAKSTLTSADFGGTIEINAPASQIEVGDIDRDGRPDIVCANRNSTPYGIADNEPVDVKIFAIG